MTEQELREIKERCKEELNAAMMKPVYYAKVADIDPRLSEYIYDCIDKDKDNANIYELLGIRKFLRMLCTYQFRYDKVKRIYRMYEALKFDGLQGKRNYRLTPTQCFELAAPFGFDYALLGDGEPERPRQLCREANYFIPRKASKTTLAAFFNFYYFFYGDNNAEIYCTANSFDQSTRLYNYTYDLIHQMDPDEKDIRFTQKGISWRDHNIRQSVIVPLSAGAKTKDGLYPQLCCADEYGSASYVKDKSDMSRLVDTVRGGMGPRWEPMTVITTTAGRLSTGPYKIKLEGICDALLQEMEYPLDGNQHQCKSEDWQFALVCQPDAWETNDADLENPNLWRKINRHLGITVQADYYENELQEMKKDPEKYAEQRCKLFNLWTTDRVKAWLTPADIRPLQIDRTIADCKSEDGWVTFAGFDFSMGNDLHAVSYLAYNTETGEFFADMDAFISEDAVTESPIGALYRQWIAGGHLHTCPGRVVVEDMFINRIEQLIEQDVFFRAFGYDSYKSKININNLRQYLFDMGTDPDKVVYPISQTIASYTAPVDELEFMIKSNPPLIRFSNNPMWPWEFGCCYLQESTDGINYKPIKSGSKESTKVDNVQALLSALICYDKINAQTQ